MSVAAYQRKGTWQLAMATLFVVLMAGPHIDLVFGLDRNPSPVRRVIPFPTLAMDRSALKVPGALRFYLESNMGFRPTLVRAHGWLKWFGMRTSPVPTAVLMQTPWLFMGSKDALDSYRNLRPFTDAELDRWQGVLEARRSALAAKGIRFLVVVVPNKETLYAEHMPAYATRANAPSRRSQLAQRMRERSDVNFLDVTSTLEAHKARARLYHYTDTHWNDEGAFVAYQAVTERLVPWFPSLQPHRMAEMRRRAVVTRGGDLARMIGLQLDIKEPQPLIEVPPEHNRATLYPSGALHWMRIDVDAASDQFATQARGGEIDSIYIVRDSFADLWVPYLSQHFARATWHWTDDFPMAAIEAQQPDLVIQQFVERKLLEVDPQ